MIQIEKPLFEFEWHTRIVSLICNPSNVYSYCVTILADFGYAKKIDNSPYPTS